MRLPDAEGFIVAAQKLLENGGSEVDVVYLHDAEGAICGVLVRPVVWQDPLKYKNREPIELHSHLEAAEPEPWIEDEQSTPPTPISPDYWETAE